VGEMIMTIIAVCFAADISGLPVNKCYMQVSEKFSSFEICEAWAYRKEEEMFRQLSAESEHPVVINIVCRTEKTGT